MPFALCVEYHIDFWNWRMEEIACRTDYKEQLLFIVPISPVSHTRCSGACESVLDFFLDESSCFACEPTLESIFP